MINYIKRLLKIAFVSTLGFGGGVALLVFIIVMMTSKDNQNALQYGINAGVVIGLIFTAFLFCIIMPMDIFFRLSIARNSKTRDSKGLLENEQTRELLIQGTNKHVHIICRQALLNIPGVRNVHDDANRHTMHASTGASWRSPGEDIDVQITEEESDNYLLHCTSKPSMKNILFDYGKNFENVELWKKNVEELIKNG